MATLSKGQETKKRIILTARRLFYEKGYQAASCSSISKEAGTNLGLISYYFGSKSDLGMIVYTDIRDAFDNQLDLYEPQLSGVDKFLYASALELLLCLNCPPFGRFYYEFSAEPAFHEKVEHIIVDALMKYTRQNVSSSEALLSCLGIMAIKPMLVKYMMNNPHQIAPDDVIHYYIRQQLNVLSLPAGHADVIMSTLGKYYFNLADCFTPIMTPLLR